MCWQPQNSPLYIGGGEGRGCALGFPLGGRRQPQIQSGRRPGGNLAPKPSGKSPPPLGFQPHAPWALRGWRTSPPGAGSHAPTAHVAIRGRWPLPVDPRNPSGGPGTLPVSPETIPVTKTSLPIYESLPPDHSGTPRDVRDLIRDSEQPSVTMYTISL